MIEMLCRPGGGSAGWQTKGESECNAGAFDESCGLGAKNLLLFATFVFFLQ
jgi:hypothetical protein